MNNKVPADLSKIIRNVRDLPTLPGVVLRITETINNPKSSAKDLAKIITGDQVLTARLLKLVNSVFYGFPQRISTVTGAIVLLGFDAIRNLLLTTSIFDMFSNTNKKNKIIQEKLWDHSLGCAVGAKVIGDYVRYDKIEELFVAGLLHDIGKIVEMLFLPEKFIKIISLVEEKNVLITAAEEEVLGYTHTDVGKLLAERWKMPPRLVNVIANHHKPDIEDKFLRETSIIHLSDILCRAMNTGSGGDNKIPLLNKIAWESLQLKAESIEPIMERMYSEFKGIRLFTDIGS